MLWSSDHEHGQQFCSHHKLPILSFRCFWTTNKDFFLKSQRALHNPSYANSNTTSRFNGLSHIYSIIRHMVNPMTRKVRRVRVSVREVSRTGAKCRKTAPGFANWIHKHRTAAPAKSPSLRAFWSGFLRHKRFNFLTRPIRELGIFGSQYANQELPRLRQPIAKTRIPTSADSRNLAHRQRENIKNDVPSLQPESLPMAASILVTSFPFVDRRVKTSKARCRPGVLAGPAVHGVGAARGSPWRRRQSSKPYRLYVAMTFPLRLVLIGS